MKDELAQIGCKDLVELAILMPKKFTDLRLSEKPILNDLNSIKVTIKSKKFARNGILSCIAWANDWQSEVVITIFNAKPFHNVLYAINKEIILHGKLSEFAGLLQFNNPKIINNSGKLEANYMLKGIKDSKIEEIKKKYLNYESLKQFNLLDKHIELLLKMVENNETSKELLNSEELNECLKFVEIFHHLSRLKTIYSKNPKHYKIDIFDIQDWINNLPFKPTNDQINAIFDIKKDLQSIYCKNRIIMGDVGCGKSLVIFAAALMCYPKQAILMAPTSVLAQQLFYEAKRLLPDFMNILLFNKSPNKATLEQLKEAHFVIGTHSLLYHEHNAVLVMIDEQQRFGAKQRESLSLLANKNNIHPHYIEFSATPIPRTTALINTDIISYSFIKQMPFKKDIKTLLINTQDSKKLFEHIKLENKNNHQAIIVYPLIEEGKNKLYKPLEEVIDFYQNNFEKVYVTHGKDKNKDEILKEFSEKGNILLSTTVIEVGISLPRLSIIVIVAPERYGLSTLHQLRGRVGRNGVTSYCYLLSKNNFSQRLLDFASTLDGFEIAEIDLQNRKSGDIIDGSIQHGVTFTHFNECNDEKILLKAKQYLEKLENNH